MKVYELIQLLAKAPHDMEVMILEAPELGGFIFKPACLDNSGITGIPEPDEEMGEFGGEEMKVFVIAEHGKLGNEEGEEPDETNLYTLN